MADEPTPLHKICPSCKRPISKGQSFREVNTPTGPASVHSSCIEAAPQPQAQLVVIDTSTTAEDMTKQKPVDALHGMAFAWLLISARLQERPQLSDSALEALVDAGDAIYTEAFRLFGERATDVFIAHGYEPD